MVGRWPAVWPSALSCTATDPILLIKAKTVSSLTEQGPAGGLGPGPTAGPHLLRPALQEPALGRPGESGEQRVQEQEPQFPKAGQDNGQEREGATRYNKVDVRTRFI